jgi:acetyltransferase AlgX (SGNH hydrolase-like protein)
VAAGTLVLCAAALEAAARWIARRQAAAPQTTRSFLRFHPTLGWEKTPGIEVALFGPEVQTTLRVNAQGLRGPERPYQKPAGRTRVLLLGDSFTEGATVDEPQTVRAVLERLLDGPSCPRYEVINGGTSGYSTDQEYLFFRGEGRRYAPDVVVLMFFSNDLQGNLETKKKPWFEVDDDHLVLRNSPLPAPPEDEREWSADRVRPLKPWHGSFALRLLGQRTESGNPRLHRLLSGLGLVEPARDHPPTRDWLLSYGPDTELTEERWRRTRALLRALDSAVSESGASLVVFYVPAGFELDERDWRRTRERWALDGPGWEADKVARRLRGLCGESGIAFVDPREALRRAQAAGERPYLRYDPHWTAAGQEVAARALVPYVQRPGSCPPSAGDGPAASTARR